MYLWKPNICHHQLDVQETNSSTESEIISLGTGLRMDGLLALDLWDVVIEVYTEHCKTLKTSPRSLVRDRKPFEQSKPRPKHQLKGATEMLCHCQVWIAYPPTHILLKASLSCASLKTTKLSSR